MKAIIIDDEPNAREKLDFLLKKCCPSVDVTAVCKNAEEGLAAIAKDAPDIVFLDIEMPLMSGFDMLKTLGNTLPFEVIFTTAYDQYAIKAIKYSALDYLLKPFDVEQLMEAVKKAAQKRESGKLQPHYQNLVENITQSESEFFKLAIPTLEGFLFVKPERIIRLESQGRYTSLFLEGNEKIVASRNLGEFEELLSDKYFVRIHHSHIINLTFIKKYLRSEGGQVVMMDNTVIDISRRKKDQILQRILPMK
ncbi:MAG: LytR/AlgR family response regulator transcription factor [Bacteroidia bacterium]